MHDSDQLKALRWHGVVLVGEGRDKFIEKLGPPPEAPEYLVMTEMGTPDLTPLIDYGRKRAKWEQSVASANYALGLAYQAFWEFWLIDPNTGRITDPDPNFTIN